MITAQNLYDLREVTGFVSGNDLADIFSEIFGEPSPKGNREFPVSKLINMGIVVYLRELLFNLDLFWNTAKEYYGEEIPRDLLDSIRAVRSAIGEE